MTTILIDMDRCDIAHEASLLEEYNAEASWVPRFLKMKQPARVTPPRAPRRLDYDEDLESIGIVHAKSLPKCP
jgi:hypothetical protein